MGQSDAANLFPQETEQDCKHMVEQMKLVLQCKLPSGVTVATFCEMLYPGCSGYFIEGTTTLRDQTV